jgi:hypothetical protein
LISKAQIAINAVYKATSHIGDQEDADHNNTGPQVNRFLSYVGLDPGYSWCMAFVCFCMGMAAEQAGGTIADAGLIKTASCAAQAAHARSLGNLVSAHDAKARLVPGWIMLKLEGGVPHHTGLVTAYDAETGIFKTIEGNTNTDGGSDGYEVARQTRGINDTIDGRPKYEFIQV